LQAADVATALAVDSVIGFLLLAAAKTTKATSCKAVYRRTSDQQDNFHSNLFPPQI
jgi:hypothetical protein